MEPPTSAPVRVLARPPLPPPTTAAAGGGAATAATSTTTGAASATVGAAQSPSPEGVVVVGFIGSRPTTDATHLINRILDNNVFGSGDLDKDLTPPLSDHWFRRRKVSYHHDAEKGMVFLHLSPSPSPLSLAQSNRDADADADGEFASVVEDCEAFDLRVMLLMFSVCHVVVFLHEGFRFDTQILKKFRMLQAAKHALAPFVKSQVLPALMPKVSPPIAQAAPLGPASVSPPGRRGARHTSAISLMSGSGSHTSVLPGQCTPVILFVFEEDAGDGSCPPPSSEDMADALNQPSGAAARPGSGLKGPGSVVVLARPMSKMEGSFRKKLHASLDAQIRFLIKKCRILAATEAGHLSSRASGVSNVGSVPLFSLDTSRVVALLDRSANERGESLDIVTRLLEGALSAKAPIDLSILENHCQGLVNEDIQSIKDFIYRQSDTLRGRGGLSNLNSGSAVGVGMVAAAAAAAAASAAAGKPVSAPELPSLENWLSSSSLIIDVLLSAKHGSEDEKGNAKNISLKKNNSKIQDGHISPPETKFVESAVACLESNKGLNLKFSISWCQRALPAAKEVYQKDLPECYPTALHKAHLEKALQAFHAMVKGPAVEMFAKKLKDECTLMWESGRQLCDAVSLTGKPCMHQRHSIENGDSPSGAIVKPHSSGYFFLHACACGRSRHVREDPFDFESANVLFNHFKNCDDLLPNLILPRGISACRFPLSSWNLVRIGGAKYYKPSKGLLQIGFIPSEKFLLKWMISLERLKGTSDLVNGDTEQSNANPKSVLVADEQLHKSDATQVPGVQPLGPESQRQSSEVVSKDDKSIRFGKGLPSFTMKKPFSEVVAGTVVADSTFPVLQSRKQPKANPGKGMGQMGGGDRTEDQPQLVAVRQGSLKSESVSAQGGLHKLETESKADTDPYLQIGSYIVPVNLSSAEKVKPNNSSSQAVVYVGFEHECSYGHRFLLSPEILKELDSSYSTAEKSYAPSNEDSEKKNVGNKNGLHEKARQYSLKENMTAVNEKKNNRSSEIAVSNSQQHNKPVSLSRSGIEKFQSIKGRSAPCNHVEEIVQKFSHVILDDGGSAFSMLNRNLPIFMNCPYCKGTVKQGHQKVKFASTISQLQRIFLVTPPFPTVLATCPVIQFEDSCLPSSIPDREHQSSFTIGCRVILPPESFLTLRLPFVYGVQMDDGNLQPLNHIEHQPELTAWLAKGTTLQVVSVGRESDVLNTK